MGAETDPENDAGRHESSRSTEPIPEQVGEALSEHRQWLDSNGESGRRADLRSASLAGLDLREVDLRSANLADADLSGADLRHARLDDARLSGADLSDARLDGASFRDARLVGCNLRGASVRRVGLRGAVLENADLTGAKGLRGGLLGGTDVSGAILPQRLLEGPGVEIVASASENARTIFLISLLAVAYAWMILADTTDAELVANSRVSSLPVVETEIPIVDFFWVIPTLLFSVFVYFQLYLHGLWNALAKLPAIFPDGRRLDERSYPWLFVSIVEDHVPLLRERRTPFSSTKIVISVLLGWCLIPAILYFFWAGYLLVHDWGGSLLHVVLFSGSVVVSVVSYQAAGTILRGESLDWRGLAGRIRGSLFGRQGWIQSVTTAVAVLLLAVIPIMTAMALWSPWRLPELGAFEAFFDPYADVVGERFSAGNGDYVKIEALGGGEKRYKVKLAAGLGSPAVEPGIDLRGRNLRFIRAAGAHLVNADLEGADLYMADLRQADLRGANLDNAVLNGAQLTRAQLQGASFEGALLEPAGRIEVKLDRAVLKGADLSKAKLHRVSASNADFTPLRLGDGSLTVTDLGKAHLEGAELNDALLSYAYLYGVRLDCWSGHGMRSDCCSEAECTNLVNAHLEGADLEGARLEGANLSHAQMYGANLRSALLGQFIVEQAKPSTNHRLPGGRCHEIDVPALGTGRTKLIKARLDWAELDGTCLQSAVLQGASLRGVRAERADFRGADIFRGDLVWAALSGARFEGANLETAVLVAADLTRALLCGPDGGESCSILHGADLRGAILDSARYDAELLRGLAISDPEESREPKIGEQGPCDGARISERTRPEERAVWNFLCLLDRWDPEEIQSAFSERAGAGYAPLWRPGGGPYPTLARALGRADGVRLVETSDRKGRALVEVDWGPRKEGVLLEQLGGEWRILCFDGLDRFSGPGSGISLRCPGA